jgi:ribose/xylose/arabinose/galactoside ABC-type transport system permease subunit
MSDVKEYGRGTVRENPKESGLRRALRSREMSLGIVILVVIAGLSFLEPEAFISLKNFEAISNGMIYDLLLAAGLTIVLILWGIDLSVE